MNTRTIVTPRAMLPVIPMAMFIAMLSCNVSAAGSLSDPTRPATAPVHDKPVSTIHVEAIVITDTTAWAIVNGIVVHQGDHVGNAVIENISRYEVRYSRNGHSDVAQLPHSTLQVRRDAASHEDTP